MYKSSHLTTRIARCAILNFENKIDAEISVTKAFDTKEWTARGHGNVVFQFVDGYPETWVPGTVFSIKSKLIS